MSNTSSKSIKTQLKKLKDSYLEAARAEFKKGCDELFDKYPELTSFGFKAYTPYFNDVEECTYSAHTSEPDINGIDGYDMYGDEHKDAQKLQEIVADFLDEFDDDVYADIIGDHVQATITRKGIKIEDYEHD